MPANKWLRNYGPPHAEIDTDYGKIFVHERLATAMGDPPCPSIFGPKATPTASSPSLQFARAHNAGKAELKAAQSWYRYHRPADGLPRDPRDLSDDELRRHFPRRR